MTLTEFMDKQYKNREDKDNMFGVGVSDTEFRHFIIDYLLGDNWYVGDPIGQTQINEIALYKILEKYSKRYRKECRAKILRKRIIRKKVMKINRLKDAISRCEQAEKEFKKRSQGEWIRYTEDGFDYAKCSACKWDSGDAFEYAIDRFPFCPNCGADMRKEGEAE